MNTLFLSDTATDVADQVSNEVNLLKEYANALLDWCMGKLGSIILAFILMAICFKLVKGLVAILKKSFEKSNLDPSVAGFLLSAVKLLLNFIVLITAASILGFQVTSLITILGTVGVTVGLALQGSLSNLAGGVLILVLKPFKVGDYIIENSTKCEGVVVSIDIFYTKLRTPDNKSIVIPNGTISNTSLVNVSELEKRRVEVEIGIAYSVDLDKAKAVAIDALRDVPGFLPDEPIDFFIDEFASSSVDVTIRFFCQAASYWDALFAARWNIKKAFDGNGVTIPFPQMDVHLDK